MGMPEITINFTEQKKTFVYRLGRGTVAYIHIASGVTSPEYYAFENRFEIEKMLESSKDKEALTQAIENMFKFGANKVLAAAATDFESVKNWLENKRFNYLAVNGATAEMVKWAEGVKFFTGRKFILFSDGTACKATAEENKRYIVSCYPENKNAVVGKPSDIASIVAGCGDRSATYMVLGYNKDFTDDELSKYPNARGTEVNTKIDDGTLCVVNDGEKLKIGRAVTTNYKKTGTPSTDTTRSAFSKIRCVDICNMIEDDIRDNFDNQYVGVVLNSYENKMGFISLINGTYLAGLEGTALSPDVKNYVDIDLQKHIEIAKQNGEDVSKMSEMDLRKYDTGSNLYLTGRIRPLDAMEDMELNFTVG